MHLRYLVAPLLVLSSLIAQAGQNNTPPQGQITATILNDEGERLSGVSLCISLRRPNDSKTLCGSVTDANGEVQIDNVKMGKVDVDAEAFLSGYWEEDTKLPRMQTVTLTPEEPFGRLTLKIGPRPGVLNLSMTDKETGKFVSTATIRLSSVTRSLGSSGTGNFEKSKSLELRVPIRPATDVMLEVSAPGYKNWFYTDPTAPSQPTLRLESGEQRSIRVEMEPVENPANGH